MSYFVKSDNIWTPAATNLKSGGVFIDPLGASFKEKNIWKPIGAVESTTALALTAVNTTGSTVNLSLVTTSLAEQIEVLVDYSNGTQFSTVVEPLVGSKTTVIPVPAGLTASIRIDGWILPHGIPTSSDFRFISNTIIQSIDFIHQTRYGIWKYPYLTSSALVAVPLNIPDAVTSLYRAFHSCTKFNQPLNDWDVSRIENFTELFRLTTIFNQPLDKWNTSAAKIMTSMFHGASGFDQNISMWNVDNVTTFTSFRLGGKLSTANTPPKFR